MFENISKRDLWKLNIFNQLPYFLLIQENVGTIKEQLSFKSELTQFKDTHYYLFLKSKDKIDENNGIYLLKFEEINNI